MNSPYIRTSTSTKKIIKCWYLVLLIISGYAFYKNGISLYKKEVVSFVLMLKPLIIIALGFLSGYLALIMSNWVLKENEKLGTSFLPIYGIITTLFCPLNISLILLFIVLFGFLFAINIFNNKFKFKINSVCLIILIIYIILLIINKFDFSFGYESLLNIKSNSLMMFFGKNINTIGGSSIFLLILSYVILIYSKNYKYNIPFYTILSYIILLIPISFIFNNGLVSFFDYLYSSPYILMAILVAPLYEFSPCIRRAQILYSALIGLLTIILECFIKQYLAIIIACFIASLIYTFFKEKIAKKA